LATLTGLNLFLVSALRRVAARLYLWAPKHYALAHLAFVVLLVASGLMGALVAVVLGEDARPGVGAGVISACVAVAVFAVYTLAVVLACRARNVPLETVAQDG
jgi:membrane associated rhomboid family serine protease